MRLHFVLVGLFAVLGAPSHAQISRVEYARQCAKEIEPLPAFNCMDGAPSGNEVHELEILVDDKAVKKHVEKCDNPVQLELSGGQGQCVPFSRLVKLNSVKPTVLAFAICRKYLDRGTTDDQRAKEFDLRRHCGRSARPADRQDVLLPEHVRTPGRSGQESHA